MHRFIPLLAIVLLITAAVPAASQDAEPTTVPAVEEPAVTPQFVPENYLIAPEDVLQIDVWGEPELTKMQVQVTPDGNITVPFIGPMTAEGKTQQQLADDIAAAYVERDILINPKISVRLMIIHKPTVYVLGQVARQGVVEFKDGDTLLEALAQAGINRSDALLEQATLTRRGSNEPIPVNLKALLDKGDMSQNHVLQKGDTIYIPEDTLNKYYVLGEVLRPNIYPLDDNITVLSAISAAGGPTPRGKLKGTMLIRGDADNPEKVPVNIAKLIESGDVTQDIKLKPGDVVYVPETSKPDWSKISSFLNTLMSVSYLRKYGLF